jgi:FixJ family two-component response regulator
VLEEMVHVVDDDEAVRNAISLLIRSNGKQARAYQSAEDFLCNCQTGGNECVILDLKMPGMSGVELQEYMAEKNMSMPVIIVTGHGDIPVAVKSTRLGAVDFIEKPFEDNILLEAVDKALEKSRRDSKERGEKLSFAKKYLNLTEREKQVMRFIVAGEPNKAIAKELNVSIKTVEFHRANLMHKMEVDSFAELVRQAVKSGIA